MELIYTKKSAFLNEWLNQINNNKVTFIPDEILTESLRFIEEKGIPTIKDENYKYIPIESIIKREFKKIDHSESEKIDTTNLSFLFDKNKIVLSEKNFFSENLEDGIKIYTLNNIPDNYAQYIGKTKVHQKDFFAALNTAYSPNLNIIHIQQSLSQPLQIHHYLNNYSNFSQNRILLLTDDNVQCTVFEIYHTHNLSHSYFYNTLTETFIGKNSIVHWINFQKNPSSNLYCINNIAFNLENASNIKHHQISVDGALWKNNLYFHINDKNTQCHLSGLSFGKNQNIISQNTSVLHHSGYSNSNQLYKNIAEDKSTVLFNGFILVDKNAQKTDAYQNSKNLLLNDNATIFAKPQLEIYADDVKCSHGSSTGALNEDALFYLKSRGINPQDAQKLLLQAFYYDIIESIDNSTIQDYIHENISI